MSGENRFLQRVVHRECKPLSETSRPADQQRRLKLTTPSCSFSDPVGISSESLKSLKISTTPFFHHELPRALACLLFLETVAGTCMSSSILPESNAQLFPHFSTVLWGCSVYFEGRSVFLLGKRLFSMRAQSHNGYRWNCRSVICSTFTGLGTIFMAVVFSIYFTYVYQVCIHSCHSYHNKNSVYYWFTMNFFNEIPKTQACMEENKFIRTVTQYQVIYYIY